MEKFKSLIAITLIAVLVAIGVAWQSPTKSYIVITANSGSGKAEYYDAKGRHEYPFLHQAIAELAVHGYRVVDVEMSGRQEGLMMSITIMEK